MRRLTSLLTIASVFAAALCSPAWAGPRLRDICRVKGQETNTLHGLGLVVGLNGTGDPDAKPTARALATTLRLMGNPLSPGLLSDDVLGELKDAKNVALVFVDATVPAAGARQGDQVQCEISAIGAQSLSGGRLMLTPLLGPNPASDRVYAFAQGAIEIDNPAEPTVGYIHGGCRLEEDFRNQFYKEKEHQLTLVLDKHHAGFGMANGVAETINTYNSGANAGLIARAVDQKNIVVDIPRQYWDEPVVFVADILRRNMVSTTESQARVVLDDATGTVVVGSDVEIGAVAVTHGNITVETGAFVGIDLKREEKLLDPAQEPDEGQDEGNNEAQGNIRLQALVNALNAIRVPSSDIIDIIRQIDESGQLYGKVVVQ